MKPNILYHGNCYDGFGAAFAAWLKFGSDANYIPVNYGKPPPKLEPSSEVFIVDFSYSAEILRDMGLAHKQVTVLDHHATAQKDLSHEAFVVLGCASENVKVSCGGFLLPCQGLQIKFDMGKSGAVLAWEHFHPGTRVPDFFLYLQDRDLWHFNLNMSREVSTALRSWPMEFGTWQKISGLLDGGGGRDQLEHDAITRLQVDGETCLRLTQQQVDIMARNARWALFELELPHAELRVSIHPTPCETGPGKKFWVPCSNATVFFSEVGERLLELHPEAPFAAYYLDRADGRRQWGLRSRPDFDCSVIAKAFGGGGHKQAAGFTQPL